MLTSTTFSLLTLAILPSALSHFILNYPQPLGYPAFNDDAEGDSPCGGQPIAFASNDTQITVGGFQLSSRTTHPQANWLFRATLSTQAPFNWTNISPVISQSGLGDFCATNLSLPAEFAGKQGLIQVTQGAVDGDLYQVSFQLFFLSLFFFLPRARRDNVFPFNLLTHFPQCAAVNFVQGSTTSWPAACTNASGVTTQVTTQTTLNDTATTSGSATSSGASATASHGAAVRDVAGGLLAMLPVGLLLL